MPSLRVQATYAGPLLFITTDQWTHVRNALKANFPLRNLHWKPASRPSIRTVQELDVDLVSLDSFKEEQSSQIPSTLLDKPLLNIYFLSCDASLSKSENFSVTQRRVLCRTATHTKLRRRSRSGIGTVPSVRRRIRNGSSFSFRNPMRSK